MVATKTILGRKRVLGAVLAWAFMAWFALIGVAGAYVFTGEHLLFLVAEALGDGNTLTVNQALTLYSQQPDEMETVFSEKLQYLLGQGFRSELENETIHRIHVRTPAAAMTVIDGKTVARAENFSDSYGDMLLYRKRIPLTVRLRQAGVDVDLTSFGRLEEQVVYIIGAQYPDESRPQLWVDKETFRPVRWIVRGRQVEMSAVELEFRYSQWRQFDKLWYPMQIQHWQKGELVRTMTAGSVIPNRALEAALFDIGRLQMLYGLPPVETPKPTDATGIDDVDKTIDEFTKLLPPQP
jgi:hypothetical protein